MFSICKVFKQVFSGVIINERDFALIMITVLCSKIILLMKKRYMLSGTFLVKDASLEAVQLNKSLADNNDCNQVHILPVTGVISKYLSYKLVV